jgi:hypothetical protein
METALDCRRDFARAEVETKVTVFFENQTFDGCLRNVSVSGAMLAPDRGMRLGAELELELPNIPGRVRARVKWLSHDGVGVHFDNPNVGVMIAGWSRGTTATSMMAASRRTRS